MQKLRKNRAALRLPCLAALFCSLLLEGLAGLEDGDGGRRDLDGFLRLGVAAHARLALLRLKAAEADELDLVALAQRFRDGVERGGDSLLGVLLGHPALLCDFRDQFGLIHV